MKCACLRAPSITSPGHDRRSRLRRHAHPRRRRARRDGSDARALDRITSTVARHGTTSIVATTVTAPVEETCRSLQGIARYIRSHENPAGEHAPRRRNSRHPPRRAIHQQSPARRPSARCHRETLGRDPRAISRSGGRAGEDCHPRARTPRRVGIDQAAAVADGMVVAMGHTDADYDQARAAIPPVRATPCTCTTPCARSRTAIPE